MGKFFIARPIFAIALAAAIVLLGIISIFDLPIEQYPDITPPVVDGSNRKFILCTNNEIKEDKLLEFQEKQLGSKPQKYTQKQKKELSQEEIIKRDLDIEKWEKDASTLLQTEECQELGICRSATYQRLKTVITGETIKGNKYSDGIPANLKYYKTDFVDKYSDDPDYFIEDKLMEHIVEMIQLENGIRIDNDKYVVLLTDEEAEEFESNIDSYHPIKIYIDGTVFLSQKIKNKLVYAEV